MASRAKVELLSMTEMADLLKENLPSTADSEIVAAAFLDNHISGAVFLELKDDELRDLVPCLGDRKEVKRIQDRYNESVVSRHGIVRTSCGRSGWLSNFSIPPFSRKTMEALENKDVTAGVRTEVIAIIAYEIWRYTQYPKKDEYNWVCQALVNKYPVLKDTIGTPYVVVSGSRMSSQQLQLYWKSSPVCLRSSIFVQTSLPFWMVKVTMNQLRRNGN